MKILAAALLVAACGGAKPTPETPPAGGSLLPCDKVADHVESIVMAATPRPGVEPGAVKELVGGRCRLDTWADDTKQCLVASATIADARACEAKMTAEQRESIKTAARALRKDAPPPEDHSADWVEHVVEPTK